MAFPPPFFPLLFLLFLTFFPSPSLSWGIQGHFATCSISQKFFSQATLVAVRNLLPDYVDGDLAKLCSWADEIRFKYKWSGPLHYIDTPDFLCNYDYDRDCHDSSGILGRCAAGAITNYTSQLTTYSWNSQSYNLTEALLFLAHIVGDIHQPLHVGFTSDLGGNTIKVHWYNQVRNLHHIWDDEIVESIIRRFYSSSINDMVNDLSNNITDGKWNGNMSDWEHCDDGNFPCPNIYAVEGVKAACKWAYKNATPGSYLNDDYFITRMPIVEMRLAQGGVRLASILNKIFDQDQMHNTS